RLGWATKRPGCELARQGGPCFPRFAAAALDRRRGVLAPFAFEDAKRMRARLALAGMFTSWIAWVSLAQARGLEDGPMIASSMPVQDSREALTSGMYYGATATFMQNPRGGVGFDVGYQRWPGSADANQSVDTFFSLITGAAISGSEISVSDFQATVHG